MRTATSLMSSSSGCPRSAVSPTTPTPSSTSQRVAVQLSSPPDTAAPIVVPTRSSIRTNTLPPIVRPRAYPLTPHPRPKPTQVVSSRSWESDFASGQVIRWSVCLPAASRNPCPKSQVGAPSAVAPVRSGRRGGAAGLAAGDDCWAAASAGPGSLADAARRCERTRRRPRPRPRPLRPRDRLFSHLSLVYVRRGPHRAADRLRAREHPQV